MADFKSLFVNLALAALVVFGILALGISLQKDNNSTENITDNELINSSYNNLRSGLESIETNATGQRILFEKENPTITYGSLILYSIVSSGKVFTNVLIVIFNILVSVPASILGIDPVIFGVIGGLFIGVILLMLWYLYKIGG
jgi:hypothetical protein